MSIAPEDVAAPADDAVVFRSSPIRTFLAIAVVVVVAYLAVSPLVQVLMQSADDPWWLTGAQAVAIGALVAGAFAFSARSSLRTWVRVSAAGLELASQGSDPVWLAWPDIAHIVVRREGARTVLEVIPTSIDVVHPVEGAGPGGPAMEETSSGTAFTADLTQLWPCPRTLRKELAWRMHAES